MNRRLIVWIIIGIITLIASYEIYNFWFYDPQKSNFLSIPTDHGTNWSELNVVDSPNYKSIYSCPSSAKEVINKYNIDKDKIENCQEKQFQNVSLIHIEYGVPQDCEAGCIFSHYCGVVENGKEYSLANHPLSKTKEFSDFIKQERETAGGFRFCSL